MSESLSPTLQSQEIQVALTRALGQPGKKEGKKKMTVGRPLCLQLLLSAVAS